MPSQPSDKSLGYYQTSLRDENHEPMILTPAINRWAIVKRPSGTKTVDLSLRLPFLATSAIPNSLQNP